MNKTIQQELIDQCRQNNRRAQLQVYQQYCKAMFRIAHRLLDNIEDAEDAMQEAFINAFQKIDQYKGDVTFGGWLKKIVINKSFDILRAKKKRFEIKREQLPEITTEDTNWEVEDSISITEIKKAILELPDKYRRVLMLYLIEGYIHEEIAQILDITIVASRTQLLRGKQKLKTSLKRQYYGSGS